MKNQKTKNRKIIGILYVLIVLLFTNISSVSAVDETTTESLIGNEYIGGGIAQGWNGDDDEWDYILPFSFNFYGTDYTDIKIGSNGMICLDNAKDCSWFPDSGIDDDYYGPFIVPMGIDLMTNENPTNDIYITENSDNVVIRWDAVEFGETDQVYFEVILYNNGNIKFNYGDQDLPSLVGGDAVVAISKGDGIDYTASVYNNTNSFDLVQTSAWGNFELYYPEDDELNVPVNSNLNITFGRDVYSNSGNIEIKKTSDDSIIETIDITSDKLSGWGTNIITINPEINLPNDTEVYINIDNGAIIDYLGIDDNSTWNFTTIPEGSSFIFEDDFVNNLKIDSSMTDVSWNESESNYSLEAYTWTQIGDANEPSPYDNVSNSNGNSANPQLVFDSNDNLYVTWWDNTTGNNEVFISRWDGSQWVNMDGTTTPNSYSNISNNSSSSYNSQLIFDSNDNLYVTWVDDASGNYEVYISRWDGSQWVNMDGTTTPNSYSNVSNTSGDSYNSQLIFDSYDNLYIVWDDNTLAAQPEIYISKWNGSGWVNMNGTTTPNSYSNVSNGINWSASPQVSFDSNDNLYVAWREYGSGEVLISRWDGSQWVNMDGTTTPNSYSNISNTLGYSYEPQLSFDSNDNLYVIWREGQLSTGDAVISRWDGSQWVNMDGTTTPNSYDIISNDSSATNPQLNFDSNDNLYVTWNDASSGDSREVYVSRWDGSQWVNMDGTTTPNYCDNVSNNNGSSTNPQLIFDSNDNLYITWNDYDYSLSKSDIYISRYNPGHISSETIQSTKVNGLLDEEILRATLDAEDSTPGASRIEYFLSNDGGTTWHEIEKGEEFIFPEGGTDLRWKAILYAGSTPTIDSVSISYSTEVEEDDDDDQGEDNNNQEPQEDEEEMIIKIKEIEESCDQLELELSTNGQEKKEKLDIKAKIENIQTKEKTEQKFSEETNSDGRVKITLENLNQNTEYKIKVKYKQDGDDEYSDWSDSKKATTETCETQITNLASVDLTQTEDSFFPGQLDNQEEQELADEDKQDDITGNDKDDKEDYNKEDKPLSSNNIKTNEENPRIKGFWNTLLGGLGFSESSEGEDNNLVKVLATAVAITGGGVLVGGAWINRNKWFSFAAFTWFKKRNWRVFDVETGDAIEGALVSLESPEGEILEEELTDNKGHFNFKASPGNNTIKVEKENYQMIQRQEKKIIEEYGEIYTGGSLNNNRDVSLNINIPMRKTTE